MKIYKQKTFWGGLTAIIGGVGCIVTGNCTPVEGAQTIMAGLLAIFLRQGIAKNK